MTPQRIPTVLILRQAISPNNGSYATRCLVPDLDSLLDTDDKQLANLLRFSSSAEFLFADCVLVVEGPSDRALLEASRDVLVKSWCSTGQPLSLAIVEAGSKAVVPVWVKYLRAIKLSACGVVDLDFLWDGAGRCLRSDPDLSQFADKFWRLAEEKGISRVDGGNCHIPPDKKAEAFSLISGDLKQLTQCLRQRLQTEAGIWVLAEGEVEKYFGLSSSSKGHYAAMSQKVRNRELQVHSEIKDLVRWATST